MGLVVFVQASACLFSVGLRLDKGPGQGIPVVPTLPGITACVTLIVFRKWLADIWDVCLHIRPGLQEHNEELNLLVLLGANIRKGSSTLLSSMGNMKRAIPSTSKRNKANSLTSPPALGSLRLDAAETA